jgi:hypothetical protein
MSQWEAVAQAASPGDDVIPRNLLDFTIPPEHTSQA